MWVDQVALPTYLITVLTILTCNAGFHPVGGTGGKLLPQTFKLPPPEILTLIKYKINYCLGFCCFQFLKTKSISSSDGVGGPSIHSVRVLVKGIFFHCTL